MEKRVKVDEDSLARVQSSLKDKGYTLDEISSEIGSDFKNFRYKGHSMGIETFQNLRELTGGKLEGSEIQYIDGKGESRNLNIEKSCSMAELTGIILGDGYLQSKIKEREDRVISAHRVLITIHSDEKRLRDRTLDLLKNLTNKEPKIHSLKSSNAIQIIINSKELIRELGKLGLETGDKVENQVEVPDWIMKDKKYEKYCLRGLLDTDGTIYIGRAQMKE